MFSIEYLESVIDDLESISKADKQRIRKAIEAKFASNPVEFGKPLQYSLKGPRRLRVGDYCVIFQIDAEQMIVLIVKIGHRREIYD
ncbi:MAG: type II toxin-antitoxin system RelE/ParE family toxin [Calothrix sp. SM1_5_4]|nr:type II toxin-antitoxin system RelE/ParE family toxin [Calothrix sp. SM1_5_4]